jgi:hypothetical protein
MIKVLIISASAAITVSVLTLIWVDRYETTKYELGSIEVYVEENKITGERCTHSTITQFPNPRHIHRGLRLYTSKYPYTYTSKYPYTSQMFSDRT